MEQYEMDDRYHLQRFLDAQQWDYERALQEVKQGYKHTHWIWYIFPQLRFLGKSDTARFYGIADLDEAKAYLQNPVLRSRLIEISQALLEVEGRTALEIFGKTDRKKVRACMTLFHYADPECRVFTDVLDKYYKGDRASWTVAAIESGRYAPPEK